METPNTPAKKRPGRKKSENPAIKLSVSFLKEDRDYLAGLSNGDISKAIRLVTQFHRDQAYLSSLTEPELRAALHHAAELHRVRTAPAPGKS